MISDKYLLQINLFVIDTRPNTNSDRYVMSFPFFGVIASGMDLWLQDTCSMERRYVSINKNMEGVSPQVQFSVGSRLQT